MSFLRRLLGLCDHKWETIDRVNVYTDRPTTITGTKYIQQCEKCGDVKSKIL